MLVASCLPTLFRDPAVQPHEARELFKQCTARLQELARKYNTITIITDPASLKIIKTDPLSTILRQSSERLIMFEGKKMEIKVWLPEKDEYILYTPVSGCQTTIDDYTDGGIHG